MDVERVEDRLLRALAAWAGASTLTGAVLAVAGHRARRPGPVGFGLQSAVWGAVDGAIAASGLVRRRGRAQPPDPVRLRRLLLVNAAADVGYVALGAVLAARPGVVVRRRPSTDPASVRGHGAAVVVQGAYLLVADVAAAIALTPREAG